MSDPSVYGGGFGRASYHKETKPEQLANRLKLSNDQKVELNTIFESTYKDSAPIVQQLLKSRQDLANALLNGKSEAEVAPLNQALSDAEFQMTGVEVKAFQRIVAILKPNQMAKAPESFDLMGGIFLPQSRGPDGPGGPGGWGGR